MAAHFDPHSLVRFSRLSKLLRASAVAAALLVTPALAPSQAAPDAAAHPDVENGKYQFEGVLIRPEFVRALPGDTFYPTMKLDTGSKVIVVGSKNNWLKILPPPGSFSYVQKAFVQAHGDGKQGKATGQLIVRAGSSLQSVMWVTQAKLEKGESVEIIGEEEQYFKIKPPAGAYLYVATDAVKPVQQVVVSPTGEVKPVGPAAVATETPAVADATPVPIPAFPEDVKPAIPDNRQALPGSEIPRPQLPDLSDDLTARPATQPTFAGDPPPVLIVPPPIIDPPAPAARPENPLAAARQLTSAEAVENLQSLEQQFTAASQLPLADQPLAELTAGYDRVSEAEGITEMMKKIVASRLGTLKVRTDSRDELLAMRAARRDNKVLEAQIAESEELRQQIKQSAMQTYTAVGTIRPSSLQVSKTQILRLTDPQTGRTLAYVWATDAKLQSAEGQFMGIRGEVKTDPRFNFKVITPSFVQPLDPQQLYTAYSADIKPPSLLPRATATTATPDE